MKSALTLSLIILLLCTGTAAAELELHFDPFGTVRVYENRDLGPAARVVILISDGKGWDGSVSEVAKGLGSMDCTVIGVDLKQYLAPKVSSGNCTYPSSDFENLSRFVQQKLGLQHYSSPVLLGYGSGGTLAYATLVQSPPKVFLGGISLGFDPYAKLLRGVCEGLNFEQVNDKSGNAFKIRAAKELGTPWILLPLQRDERLTPGVLNEFTSGVDGARLVEPSVEAANFPERMDAVMTQIKDALASLSSAGHPKHSASSNGLEGLPLVELPAEGTQQDIMVVFLSGDGGWVGLDREMGLTLNSRGIPVVGLNSLQYFWTPRTPEGGARDLALLIKHYIEAWGKTKVVLIGYSFGADVLPFLVNRLPADVAGRIIALAMLGPSKEATFEFHLTDWIGGASTNGQAVLPELEKLTGKKIVCVYGEEESDSLCRSLDAKPVQILAFPGGHHFDGGYARIVDAILKAVADPK